MAAPIKRAKIEEMSTLKRNDCIKQLKDKTKGIINDRKNANQLIDVILCCESDDPAVVVAAIQSLHKVFSHLIKSQEMYLPKPVDPDNMPKDSEGKYKTWLRERYDDATSSLCQLLTDQHANVQELALCTLMKFVKAEGETPLRKISENAVCFPALQFKPVVEGLLSSKLKLDQLITHFQEFLEYDDVRYYTMKTALIIVKEQPKEVLADTFTHNCLALLEQLTMPMPPSDDRLNNFLTKPPEKLLKINNHKEHKKLFSTLWLEFLKLKLSVNLYKQVLLSLHEKVMPHFTSPLLLSDFLTESYNIGGAISLLSLNSLFVLVNKFNLNYPDFYEKLYALLEPSIFHAKYQARFLFLVDLFLTSTYLPGYLVAAFAKKFGSTGTDGATK
ncbi:Nucleolar complex-like protein 4 [Lamellibrachia satsuma]|nr:Nucleolar complex-like protein 4 [Lamellibrachia satsuma]